jgi:hypothetical protein
VKSPTNSSSHRKTDRHSSTQTATYCRVTEAIDQQRGERGCYAEQHWLFPADEAAEEFAGEQRAENPEQRRGRDKRGYLLES